MPSRAAHAHCHYTRHAAIPPKPSGDPLVQPVAVSCSVGLDGGTSMKLHIFGFAAGRPHTKDVAGAPAGVIEPEWDARRHWLHGRFVDPANAIDSGTVQALVNAELRKHAPYDRDTGAPINLAFNAAHVTIQEQRGVYSIVVTVLPQGWMPLPTAQRAVGALWRPVIDALFKRAKAWPSHYSRTVDDSESTMRMTLYCTRNDTA